eukprot:Sro537_g162390.2  (544) ;mRNA; r:44872-46666
MGVACSKHDATAHGSNPHQHPYNDHLGATQANGGSLSSCMGCSGMDPAVDPRMDSCRADAIDPVMYDLCRKSLNMTLHDEETKKKERQESAPPTPSQSSAAASSHSSSKQKHHRHHQQQRQRVGQYHLLYKNQTKAAAAAATSPTTHSQSQAADAAENSLDDISTVPTISPYSTRLIVRRRPIAAAEEGTHGTHLYAIRYPPDDVAPTNKIGSGTPSEPTRLQEQAPSKQRERKKRGSDPATEPIPEPPRPSPNSGAPLPTEGLTDFFQPSRMKQSKTSRQTIQEWVTVSEEHCIYVVDVGLTPAQCDKIVAVTEQVCRGQYAAYTYAKQTLGCREFPVLAQACAPPVQSVVQAILGLPSSNGKGRKDGSPQQNLQLDDREPHLVKYDVTKKERQKLDMHTDKSEWTFLIALSNGCGLDYDGGGTYFECLNATIHVQRGHALIFPGKLRHCGQRITRGLRYLLVGFLVDKAHLVTSSTTAAAGSSSAGTSASGVIKGGTSGKDNDTDEDNKKSNNNGGNSTSATMPVSAKSLTTGLPTTIANV